MEDYTLDYDMSYSYYDDLDDDWSADLSTRTMSIIISTMNS